ncbi:MAG: ABC transporter permease [Clostridiales bacterium]|nr:ABC transporter permease [Clostridiales bacterium]
MNKMMKSSISLIAALISIVAGLLVGLGVMFAIGGQEPLRAMGILLTSGLPGNPEFGKVLYQAAPLIMTGLSVGFAFKTGLFNIGASGQFTVGSFVALLLGLVFKMPWYVCMIGAAAGGAIWGFFPGFFKAFFNVNEVITSIMFNWIGLYAVCVSIANIPPMLPRFYHPSGITNETAKFELAGNPGGLIPKIGLDKLFGSPYMGAGVIIAILLAVLVWVILNKTTFGYELKACGLNKSASIYAGINAKRNIILSMVIAGALSGIAGSLYYQSGVSQFGIKIELAPMGFNGIPVALLATSHPLGIIFSAIFISFINVGGEKMQQLEYSTQVIAIIIAVIIYFSAFFFLVKGFLAKVIGLDKSNVNAEPAPVIAPAGEESETVLIEPAEREE